MTKLPREHYDRLNKDRGQSGLFRGHDDYVPTKFDLDLLRAMPDQGAMKGRYLEDVLTVPMIKRLLDPSLTSGYVSTRLRTMRDEGLVVRNGAGAKAGGGWQRTAKGRALATRGTLAESSD
jgi:hypothetical protein